MPDCDEAVVELEQLLTEVRVPALLPDDAARILARSGQLARECSSEAVAGLDARIQRIVAGARSAGLAGRTRRGGSVPSPRLAALERALRGSVSIVVLRRALADGGFHRTEELAAADALHFQAIVAGPLLQLEKLYRDIGDVSAERLTRAGEELDELTGLVPACMKDADASIAELRASLARRAAEAEARARLDLLAPALESLLGLDDPPLAQVHAARDALEQNPWAAGHPDHPDVVRAAELLDRLREKRTVCDELQRLPQEVSQALSARPHQVGEAVRRIDDVHGRASAHAIGRSEPLHRSAERVMEAARERLLEIEGVPQAGAPHVEELRRVAGEAGALGDALRLLPEPLAPGAAALVRACQALAREAEARIEALVQGEVAAELARLAFGDVLACAERLEAGEHPLVREHGERLRRLHAAALELERAGDGLDDAALDRLQADAGGVPIGPFRESLHARLAECRAARAELAGVEEATEGTADVGPLRQRLGALRERFPQWARVAAALDGLADLEAVRRVRERAAEGGAGLAEARRVATGITVPLRRARVLAALGFLEDVGRALPRLRRALAAAAGRGAEGRERRVGAAVVAARALFGLLEAARDADFAQELPGPWREADAAAREALLDGVPATLREWLESAVASATGLEGLDRVEAVFAAWVGDLGAAFPAFLESHGRQLLETARVELRIAPMLAEGRFDPARALLRDAGGRLHPDELARQERRVERGAAVAGYRRDGAAALDAVVQAVLLHGADDELVDVLLEAFAVTGSTVALAAVAGQGEGRLAAFPGVAQLARWCLLFQRGLLDDLVAELGSGAAGGNLDGFVAALARSERCGQAMYVLDALRGRDGWSEAQAAALDGGMAALRQALDRAHRALAAGANALEAALDAEPPGPPPTGAPSLADVQAAAAAATRDTEDALERVTGWQDALNDTLRWLPRALVPRRTRSLSQRLRALRGRLLGNQEVLAEIHDTVWGTRLADMERWRELQRRFRQSARPVGRVMAAERLVHAYVQDWQFIADIVHWLVEVHADGGGNATPAKLDAELRRLDTYRYDFASDRFNLLPLLEGGGMEAFAAGLRTQVAEVAEVSGWLRECRAVMAGIVDAMHVRMERWHRLDDRRKRVEAVEIRALLDACTGGHPSAAALYDRLPGPVRSPAAKEMLRAGTANRWFTDLEAAVVICRDRPIEARGRTR